MTQRVLLVGPRGHGGEEVYVRSLLEHPPDGVSYVCSGDFHQGARGAPCRKVEEVFLNRFVHPLGVPDLGFRALRLAQKFDLVHVHGHPARLSGLGSTPLVMSEGSSSAVYLKEYLNWPDERLAKRYARTRCIYRLLGIHDRLLNLSRVARLYVFSKWARAVNIRWGADPEKIDVVYPGFPTPPEVDRSGRDEFTFLFVGTDFERKGGFELVAAFAAVAEKFPFARLHVVSLDPERRNPDRLFHEWVPARTRRESLVQFNHLIASGRARWEPLCERELLYSRVYPAADAFVMPSHAEGFGFTNVEALSFGLPVVSSTVGAIPEAVRANVTGVLVKPGDVAALADAMTILIREPALTRRMGVAGRNDFLARFTIGAFRASVGDIYRRALES